MIAGIFDDKMLELRKCNGIEISKEKFCVAVSMYHRLANRKSLKLSDLHGETLMVIKEGWGNDTDNLRKEILEHHPQIQIKDFDFYNVDVFNQCENSNDLLLAVKNWESVHPLIKMIPVDWDYEMSFGLLYSKDPEPKVQKLLKAIERIKKGDL